MVGLFVTFEGPEGSGKTTQVSLLAEWLCQQGVEPLTTREPGGTRIGDSIRSVLLDPSHTEMRPQTEILLFSAARAQVVGEVIRPHLERGGVVLCDRFADSTLAYQGYGRQLDLPTLRTITAFATGNLTPDLTFYLDLPVEDGLRRKRGTGARDGLKVQEEWNRFEREKLEFHERARLGFLALAASDRLRWQVLDGAQDVGTVQTEVRSQITPYLAGRGRLK